MHQFQRDNLLKLSTYLDSLPADYEHFGMAYYCATVTERDNQEPYEHIYDPEEVEAVVNTCGTSACALGHGPAAGITPLQGENWIIYGNKNFGTMASGFTFEWMFGEHWDEYDNTPRGAAARIKYFLAHSVPEDFRVPYSGQYLQNYQPFIKVD